MSALLEAESGIDIGYDRSGTLHIARAEESLAEFAATHRQLEAIGVRSATLSAAEARIYEPNLAPDIFGGLLIPDQGLISAPETTRALVLAAERHGATFLEPALAHRIASCVDGVDIDTGRGRIHAGTVVLAAGAWSGQIEIAGATPPVPVTPVRGQLLHLGWEASHVARIIWDERCYLVPWRDGTLLVGATVESAGFDERPTVAGVRQLLENVCDLLPEAWTATLIDVRVGLRPGSPDPLPIIGWSEVVPGPDVRDRPLSQRRAARPAHGAARRGCHARRGTRSCDGAYDSGTVWKTLTIANCESQNRELKRDAGSVSD